MRTSDASLSRRDDCGVTSSFSADYEQQTPTGKFTHCSSPPLAVTDLYNK